MYRRLAYNTGVNLATMLVKLTITFIMTPIYVRMLGHYDYGLREMILAVVGYMGMLELGMWPTMSRYISMYNAKGDRDSMLVVYNTSLVFMTGMGLLLAIVFWLWGIYFPATIAPEQGGLGKYTLFLCLVGVSLLFTFPKIVAESHLEGLQFYYIKNSINMVLAIITATIAYIYITPENGLILLTSLGVIGIFVQYLVYSFMLSLSRYGALFPKLSRYSSSMLREMLTFGIKSFIQGTAARIESMSDRIVIGAISGPSLVPVYSIPASLLNYLTHFAQTLTHAFMPYFSDLDSRGHQDKIKQVYLVASKLIVSVLMAAGMAIMVAGGPFIEVWMQGEFRREQMDGIIILLTLYILVPAINPFASRYLTAIGRHGFIAKVAPIAALSNLFLSIWLVFEYGVIGAAIGSVIPVFFLMPVILSHTCKHLGLDVMEYLRYSILPLLLPAVLMASALLWLRSFWRMDSYGTIITSIVLSGVLYICICWFVSLGKSEKDFITQNLVSRIKGKTD